MPALCGPGAGQGARLSPSLHVIIRSAAERTAAYCCADLVRQTSASQVERVESAPFWRTLREGLQRGQASGAEWVLSVDADVIPAPDTVARIQPWLAKADGQVGVITCMIQDKFMGGMRFGGVRIYRGAALTDMLEVMPPSGADVRPETATINASLKRGWREQQTPEMLGLHDFEQYYRDIYRKAFLHMQKHGYMAARFLPAWKEQAVLDPDFRAALAGAGDALFEMSEVDCDATHAAYQPAAALKRVGLVEKSDLQFDDQRYRREVEAWQVAQDSGRSAPISVPDQSIYDRTTPEDEIVQRIARIGENLKLYAGFSGRTKAAALHQVRRALLDHELLGSFSTGELARYARSRLWHRWRR